MTRLSRIASRSRLNILITPGILLIALALTSFNASASSNEIDVSRFNQALQTALSKLSSEDLFEVRQAIGEITRSHDPDAETVLKALWNGATIPGVEIQPAVLQNPVVRSRIAHGLIMLGNKDREYTDYIVQLTQDQDLTIQIFGLEALRDIDDRYHIDILATFANHSNPKVAEIAISGVRYHMDDGNNREYASRLWALLKSDPSVDHSIVVQYEKSL